MTHLYIDAGNTRLKWRARVGDGAPCAGAGTLGSPQLFAGLPSAPITAISVSTVMSASHCERLSSQLNDRFGIAPVFHWTQSAECGIRCAYADPATMGADRWHALIAAWSEVHGALLVIDAGSALTLDVLDGKGVHQGGFILPGHRLMRESLEAQTARVKFGEALSLDIAPGNSTDACVRNGLSWLWTALIDRVDGLREDYGAEAVFLTGGDSDSLMKLGLNGLCRPELVLDGLEIVAAETPGV